MKNIVKYLSVLGCGILATGALTSCDNDEFLTVHEYQKFPIDYMFQGDDEAKQGANSVYKLMTPYDDTDGDWGFKPNLFTGCHPTLDTQATGWDKDWLQQNWNSTSGELLNGWKHCYVAISRANEFLAGLENADKVSAPVKKSLEGEVRALRGFFYHWLATTFRRVPTLATGETYITTPQKARAATDEEMWGFIIDDMKAASELLDWKPMGGEYGRATKGMALTYLADSYMWLAYRYPEKQKEYITEAKKALEQVVNSGEYQLVPSFATLWDVKNPWNKETVWAEILDNTNWQSSWGDGSARMFTKFYCACPANGGWGSLFLSWEWYASFEKGDKRRDGSACTGPVENIREDLKSDYCYGINPYLSEQIPNGGNVAASDTRFYHNGTVEKAPSIWTLKLWRNASAAAWGGGWGGGVHQSNTIYWKRYANVLIDLAECNFILGNEAAGWALLDQVRDRANGKLEVGKEAALDAEFTPAITALTTFYNGTDGYPIVTTYPVPFGQAATVLPSAKSYYETLKASGPTWFEDGTGKPYKSAAWKVAVNMERRKEFNCEWSLRPDMQRSGFMEEHIEINYPKHNFAGGDNTNSPWFDRQFEYNPERMDMPIPADEITKNPLCDQNPAYEGED